MDTFIPNKARCLPSFLPPEPVKFHISTSRPAPPGGGGCVLRMTLSFESFCGTLFQKQTPILLWFFWGFEIYLTVLKRGRKGILQKRFCPPNLGAEAQSSRIHKIGKGLNYKGSGFRFWTKAEGSISMPSITKVMRK